MELRGASMTGRKKAFQCGKCKKKVEDKPQIDDEQSIECDCCLMFYHIVCVGVSTEKLDAVTKLKLHWYCPTCEPAAVKLKQQCVNLQAEQDRIRKEIDEIHTKIGTVKSELEKKIEDKFSSLDEKINEINSKVESTPPDDEEETINSEKKNEHIRSIVNKELKEKLKTDDEEKLREKKKLNLIFFDVTEDAHEKQEDLMLDEFYKIKDALKDKVQFDNEDISHITRIGKKTTGKTRPVLITFKQDELKMKVLRAGKDLKIKNSEGELQRAYISLDRTPKQRETDKKLREEIKARKANGEKDLVIRNEKIVPFRPGAQKSWASLFD